MTKREQRPITHDLLHKIKSVWDSCAQEVDIIMLWVACCLAFMPISELTVPTEDG